MGCVFFPLRTGTPSPDLQRCPWSIAWGRFETMPYRTIPYHTMPYHALSYHAIPHHTTPYQYHSIPCHTEPYHTIPYHTIPYHTIPYHTIPYQTIPYHTIPYHAIPHVCIFLFSCARVTAGDDGGLRRPPAGDSNGVPDDRGVRHGGWHRAARLPPGQQQRVPPREVSGVTRAGMSDWPAGSLAGCLAELPIATVIYSAHSKGRSCRRA